MIDLLAKDNATLEAASQLITLFTRTVYKVSEQEAERSLSSEGENCSSNDKWDRDARVEKN